jgi:glutamate dehydrogenase (NAD(P)+)
MSQEMNSFEIAQQQLAMAAEVMGLDEATHELLRWPMREFHVHFPVRMDNGTTRLSGAVQRCAGADQGWASLSPSGDL